MSLSVKKIEKLKNAKPARYLDQRGLLLQVRSPTNCSWIFRYEKAGHQHLMGLGSLRDVSLDAARTKATKLRQQIADGLDPIAERERERAARNPYLFIGQRTEGLSNMAMNQLLKRMDWKDKKGKSITTHGFRSSFRSFIAAKTSFPSEMAELALAHNVGDETYRAYQRDDLVEQPLDQI